MTSYCYEVYHSSWCIRFCISQLRDDEKFHPIAFQPRNFEPTEINYEINEKELLTIVYSFEQLYHFVDGFAHHIIVYNDHKNLTYFQNAEVLN